MTDLATLESSELVSTIARARTALDEGDVQAALLLSSGAYVQAKAAASYAESVKASRTLVDKARRLQADALKIEALAYVAMADAVDEAQEKGELARRGRQSNVPDGNVFTLEDVGLTAKRVHEARKLRSVERANPGFIERVVEERIQQDLEPSRAGLKKAVAGIGTRSRSEDERAGDSYFTSIEAMWPLLALESFSATIKEPACGAGHISKPMEAAGYEVILSDIRDRGTTTRHGEVQQVGDFLQSLAGVTRGLDIVTNPPYGRKVMNRFIAHALREHQPRKMALLLNLNVLCGFEDPDRLFIMDENPPSRAYVFTRRLPMMHQEGWEGEEASSQMNTAWFIWERNDDGSYGAPGLGTRMMRVDYEHYRDVAPLAPGAGGCVAPMLFRPSEVEDEDFARETPRKTLDERVESAMQGAIDWIRWNRDKPELVNARGLRLNLGIRDTTAQEIIARLAADGRLVAVDGGWRWAGDAKAVAA